MKVSPTHNRRLRDYINVAIAQETTAAQAVQNFRKRLEADYGFPIVFERLEANASAGGTVRPYWDQRTNVRHHSIDLEPCEKWVRPHKLAHELMHIALECEAHVAGKRLTCGITPQKHTRLLSLCDQPPNPIDVRLINLIASHARNTTVDLVVEARLQRELPAIAAAQFVGLHLFDSLNRSPLQGCQVSPILRQALEALVAFRSLFVDTYFPNPSQSNFEQFRGTPAGDMAGQLFAEFKTRFDRGLQPGEHYELMNRHAEIIRLPGLHSWSPEPGFRMPQSAPSLSAVLNGLDIA